jgi:beta-lactam-binding protein with PASTA domain
VSSLQSDEPPASVPGRGWFVRQDWLLAIALAAFVGVVVWFGRSIQEFFAPSVQTIAAPALVGVTVSDALATTDRMRLHGVVVQHAASDRYPKDVVMRQDPAPGTQVRVGRQISMVVSTGAQLFAMPDLRYETMREVNLDLSRDKLLLGKTRYGTYEDVPPNRVAVQDPPPLSSVRPGTVVNLDISKGPPPGVKVPNFVGMSVDEARDAATSAQVHIGQIVWTPFGTWGPPRGAVVRQRPPAGGLVAASGAVSLQVSAGPDVTGYLVRQVHATATVPSEAVPNGKPATVRIEVHDQTGTWNVYNAYAEPRQKLDFNLTVVGTAQLETYINGELVSTTSIGVEPPLPAKRRSTPPRAAPVPKGVPT